MDFENVKKAIKALQEGKIILVTDDEDRENEGDLICSAESATTENVNFIATYAKGLICTPMSREIAQKLMFDPMVANNTDNHEKMCIRDRDKDVGFFQFQLLFANLKKGAAKGRTKK